jgi:hypothetical protein
LHQVVPATSLDSGYGMLRPKSSGKPRNLDEFDVAQAMRRGGRK